MLCYAMLCYAVLCCAVLCCAVLCYAMLCCVVQGEWNPARWVLPACAKISVASNLLTGTLDGVCHSYTPALSDLGE